MLLIEREFSSCKSVRVPLSAIDKGPVEQPLLITGRCCRCHYNPIQFISNCRLTDVRCSHCGGLVHCEVQS